MMVAKTFRRRLKERAISEDRPKRPISAYNIFFRFARQHMVSLYHHRSDAVALTFKDILNMDDDVVTRKVFDIVEEYRSKGINRNDNYDKKRRSKTSGKIGFIELSDAVANQWKILNPSMKSIFDTASKEDKKTYTIQRNDWTSKKDARIKQKLQEQYDNDDNDEFGLDLSMLPNDKVAPLSSSIVPSSSFSSTANMHLFHVTHSDSPFHNRYGNIGVAHSKSRFDRSASCKQILVNTAPDRQLPSYIEPTWFAGNWLPLLKTDYDYDRDFEENLPKSHQSFSLNDDTLDIPELDFEESLPRSRQPFILDDDALSTPDFTSVYQKCSNEPHSDFHTINGILQDDVFGSERDMDLLLSLLV